MFVSWKNWVGTRVKKVHQDEWRYHWDSPPNEYRLHNYIGGVPYSLSFLCWNINIYIQDGGGGGWGVETSFWPWIRSMGCRECQEWSALISQFEPRSSICDAHPTPTFPPSSVWLERLEGRITAVGRLALYSVHCHFVLVFLVAGFHKHLLAPLISSLGLMMAPALQISNHNSVEQRWGAGLTV